MFPCKQKSTGSLSAPADRPPTLRGICLVSLVLNKLRIAFNLQNIKRLVTLVSGRLVRFLYVPIITYPFQFAKVRKLFLKNNIQHLILHILKKFLGFSFELTIVHGKRKKNRDEKFMHYLESKIAGMVPRTRRLRTAVSPSRIRALYYIRSGGLYGRHLLPGTHQHLQPGQLRPFHQHCRGHTPAVRC